MTGAPANRRFLVAAGVVLVGLVISAIMVKSLWTLDSNGLSQLNGKLPIWDFSNLWAAGHFVREGRLELLFDPPAYRAALRALFTPLLTDQEWSYPPSMLLIGVPLAFLPALPAYLLWTFGTLSLFHLSIRTLKLPLAVQGALLVSPGVVMSVVVGQNGVFTASLLLGGLLLVERRPVLSGVLIGLLTVKPHLGLLLPFCLLANRKGKTFAAATLTALLLVAVTALLFEPSVWMSFRTVTAPMMTGILEAPYPQSYHTLALTVFTAARSFGWGLGASYGLQAFVSALCLAASIWLWWPRVHILGDERRAVLTGLLTLIATPYGYVYDCVPLSVAAAYFFVSERRIPLAVHAIVWLFPLFVPFVSLQGFGAGIVVPIAYTTLLLGLAVRDTRPSRMQA